MLLTREKKGLFLDPDMFSLGEEKGKGFYHTDCLFFLCGDGRCEWGGDGEDL